MTLRVLQKVRDRFWPAGTEKVTGQAQPYYSDSEIGLIKLRLRENSEIAMAKQRDRGTAINPKILAARKSGATV
jgi:hypothetical protein